MLGLYKGTFILGDVQYQLQHSISNTAERIDIMYLQEDPSGFYVMTPDAIKMMCSVYIKNGETYFHGNYALYTQLQALQNTVKYYYFRKEDTIKDGSVQFEADGISSTYHVRTQDHNLEMYKVEHQGNVTEMYYRCGINTIDLTFVKGNQTVKKLGKLEYEKLDYEEDVYDVATTSTYRSLNEIATFKNLDWIDEKEHKYKVITTIEEFNALVLDLKKAVRHKKAIAFDTETTGVKFNRLPLGTQGRDELVGICISHKLGYGWYIPVGHLNIENIPLDYCIQELKWILETGEIVTHYGKFDANVMRTYGVDLNIVDDTYIMLYILSNIDAHNNLKLKNATKVYLKRDQIGLDDIFPGSDDGDSVKFQILPYDIVKYYACCDADVTLEIYNILKDKIPELSKSLYKHEVYQMRVLSETEYFGNKVDIDLMKIEAEKCLSDIKKLEVEIYKMAGYVFNINSSPMLSKLLYEELKCEVLTKTTQGTPSTGATALKNLSKKSLDSPVTKYSNIESDYEINAKGEHAVLIKGKDLNNAKYPIIHVILAYKKLVKLHSTFFTGMARDSQGGWSFASYNQTRAATGRIISNFQQIPGSLKHLIVPWSDDYYMINLDYKSIELYVMVGVAGQQEVIEQFSDPESDAHRIIGAQILKKSPQEISGKERKDMKVANFGVPYDMGPHALAQFLFGFPVTRENVEYAKQLKADYLNSMPKVKRMFNDVRDRAQTKGIVNTKFGRMGRFTNLVKETDPGLIARGRRQSGNLIIQGTAADIMKIASNRLHRTMKQQQIDACITATIHDELILIVNKKHHPYQMINIIKECMELKIKGFPTIFTGISVSHNWGEGHGLDILEIPQYLAQRMAKDWEDGNLPDVGDDPRDFILGEIREYLTGRFTQYLVDLGLNLENPEETNFYNVLNNFKHMYLGPRVVAHYTDFGGCVGEPRLDDAIKMAIRDAINWDIEKVENYIKRDTPVDKEISFDDIEVDFDIDEFVAQHYEFEDGDEVSLEDAETVFGNDTSTEQAEEEGVDQFKVFSTYDSILINLEGCTRETVQELTAYFEANHIDNGFMSVMYKYHKDIIKPNFRVDNVERDVLLDIIQRTTQKVET